MNTKMILLVGAIVALTIGAVVAVIMYAGSGGGYNDYDGPVDNPANTDVYKY